MADEINRCSCGAPAEIAIDNKGYVQVKCTKCKNHSKQFIVGDTRKQAIEDWNKQFKASQK